MKVIIIVVGILLVAGGGYLVYDGYQQKNTAVAKVEQEVSNALRALTDDNVRTKTKVNNESAAKMIGGGVGAVTGIVLIAAALRRKRG